MVKHIKVDENGYIIAIRYLSSEVEEENLFVVSSDFDETNKKLDFETETWVEYEPEPTPDPEPTQLDRIEEAVNEIKNSENSEAINALLGG